MNEDDYLMMSGLQHFDFCRRQWALIHIEQQWKENALTAQGRVDHVVCDDDSRTEKRKDLLIVRGMRVVSKKLKLSGICDVVEFRASEDGIPLEKYEGKWLPIPVEYKHGHIKTIDADRIQLCAEAMALEEMLACKIEYGFLFYKETNKRERVDFTDEMRDKVTNMALEMIQYFQRGWTPKVRSSAKCKSCSLMDLCLPKLLEKRSVTDYIEEHLRE
ncbi:MAG: CRISPR-associated protein Cas4 [Lachnospiraceae bacterium]|nr:CRISPR-associated protein Cas4 [Lachnospiraceae bacterium]